MRMQVAVESGACLVPVIAFGEPDTFDTYIAPPGSPTRRVLKWVEVEEGPVLAWRLAPCACCREKLSGKSGGGGAGGAQGVLK